MRWRWRLLRLIPSQAVDNSFEVFVYLLGLFVGFVLVFGVADSVVVDQSLPDWLTFLWALMLIAGCGAAFSGLMKYEHAVERFGLMLLAPASLVYAILLVSAVPWRVALLAAAPYVVFSWACSMRIYVLTLLRDVKVAVVDAADGVGDGRQ